VKSSVLAAAQTNDKQTVVKILSDMIEYLDSPAAHLTPTAPSPDAPYSLQDLLEIESKLPSTETGYYLVDVNTNMRPAPLKPLQKGTYQQQVFLGNKKGFVSVGDKVGPGKKVQMIGQPGGPPKLFIPELRVSWKDYFGDAEEDMETWRHTLPVLSRKTRKGNTHIYWLPAMKKK
jgi:hypothetical protein